MDAREPDWQRASDEELERLLVERWLSRGLLVGILALAAIASTYVASRGLTDLTDRLTFATLLALGVAAAVVAFVMRRHDRRVSHELRRRHGRSRGE